jgi:DNA-binding MarR family transcriptional regulator
MLDTIDALIANPGRLRILTALASEPRQEFVQLRGVTQMTDGNLASHARRLHSAGLVQIDKTFRDGKPVTTFILTHQGRGALEEHVENLMRVLRPSQPSAESTRSRQNPEQTFTPESDWID